LSRRKRKPCSAAGQGFCGAVSFAGEAGEEPHHARLGDDAFVGTRLWYAFFVVTDEVSTVGFVDGFIQPKRDDIFFQVSFELWDVRLQVSLCLEHEGQAQKKTTAS
jgi:hypothetical protein